MTENNKELLTKIGNIQGEINSLIKDETIKSTHANYKYFEESQVLKILKPLLKENKLTVLISDDDSQPLQWDKENNQHYLRYLKKMEITDWESGQTNIYRFWASGNNTDLAKAKGSAETYAMKYILSKFFLIRVIDDNDPELKQPEPVKTQPKPNESNHRTLKCFKCGNTQLKYEPRINKNYCGKCNPNGV